MPRKKDNRIKVDPRLLHEAEEVLRGLQTLTPLQVSEALASSSSLHLMLEDRGWIGGANQDSNGLEQTQMSREKTIKLARLFWRKDPLAKQAVRLWTVYSLGTGLSFKASDEKTQNRLLDFWKNPQNRPIFSSQGQQKSSKRLLTDGDLFFVIFGDRGEDKVVRRIDSLQVVDIVSDPDDDEKPWFYKREFLVSRTKRRTIYYRDWALTDEEFRDIDLETLRDNSNKKIGNNIEESAVVYHVAFDALSKRGSSLLESALDWSSQHRKFMESRASLAQALMRFAYKLKTGGGQPVLDELQKKLASTLTEGNPIEGNPPPSAGSIFIQNEKADLLQFPRSTGGKEARNDSDMFKLMVSAGTNIMLHYFGDPSTGNLATATAMELPMLKAFQSYQQQWTDVYLDLFGYALDDHKISVDIDWPPIIEKDITKFADALQKILTTVPELNQKELWQQALLNLGVNNIPEILERIEKEVKIQKDDQVPLAEIVNEIKHLKQQLGEIEDD